MSTPEQPEVQVQVAEEQTTRPRMTEEEFAAFRLRKKEARKARWAEIKVQKKAAREAKAAEKAANEAAGITTPEDETTPKPARKTKAKKDKVVQADGTSDVFDDITTLYKKDDEFKAFLTLQYTQYVAIAASKGKKGRVAVYTQLANGVNKA